MSHYNFTYAWSPVTERPQEFDWIDIRKDESKSPHIRCYWLRDGKEEELLTLMGSIIDCGFTAALILVNTKDDFDIDAKFLSPNQECVFPVAVMKNTDGQILREILMKYNEVEARMKITSVTTSTRATEIQLVDDVQPKGLLSLIIQLCTVCYNSSLFSPRVKEAD